ncbi:MAG TPA: outer membrane beta-barrel protein [Bradyrhizobium sp.]|nr:outer membrane beta-barrel protein [Bradyrhizobium sp.]
MNRPLIFGIAFLSAIVALEPVLAAEVEMPTKAPARPKTEAPARPSQTASTNWTGGQIGGSNGVSSVNNNFVEPGAYVCPANFPFEVSCFESPFSFKDHPLSYTVGPFLGYRWQLGMTVVGVEADWSWKRGESSSMLAVPFVCFDGSCQNFRSDSMFGSVKQGWDSSLRLRYGVLVTPSTLVYGTAGLAVGQISGSFSYHGTVFFPVINESEFPTAVAGSTASAAANWSDDRVGGTAGVGVETEVWAGWKARIEYRYTDYGNYTKSFPLNTVCAPATGCSAPSSGVTINLRESFHTIRVGLGYDF